MIRAIAMAMMLAGLAGCGADRAGEGPNGVAITLHGDIGTVDRGASQGALEPLFLAYGIEFDAACVLSVASLAAMEQHSIRVSFPLGSGARRFSGPLLRDVMDIADPRGTHLTLTALDGYQRTIALSDIRDHDVILAIRADGDWLGLGGYGPAIVVWPRDTDPALAGQDDADWVWGVFAIESVTPPASQG